MIFLQDQIAGILVRHIVVFMQKRLDFRTLFPINSRLSVYDTRYGAGGYPRHFRNIIDRHKGSFLFHHFLMNSIV